MKVMKGLRKFWKDYESYERTMKTMKVMKGLRKFWKDYESYERT